MAENVQKILSIELKANDAIQGLQKLNSQIEENRARMKELADANQKGSLEYAKLEQQTKALSKAKQSLSRETQNEIKLEYEQKGSINALQAELSRLTQKYNALSEAERKNGAEGKRLNKQINEITNELNAAEQGIQKYYRNVGNYQNAIIGAMGANNKYIQSIMLIASSSQGATGAFGAITTSIKAFGNALWGLMSNPVFLAIAGIAGTGMAFKWFYDYNVEVEKATRLTREFTGVTGSELTHLRAEIQATASTFGKDYKEVLEGVDLLMSHFGLTSSEAIKTLNDGFVIGADINGNYLQLLKQYAPVFKDAGVNAQQLVALIQQTRSGIFSQQGLEAIKQASARIREMSAGTRSSLEGIGIDVTDLQRKLATHEIEMIDAVQMVSDKLKETSNNTQEYGNVMADVFGRQGKFSSQEMIESLGDIDTNLQHLKDSAGEYGKALEDNQQATADLEEETAKLFNTGENGWETLKLKVDTYWKKGVSKAIGRTNDLINKFLEMGRKSDVFRITANIVISGIVGMSKALIGVFGGIGSAFKTMGSWVEAFVNTFKSAFNAIKDMANGVGDILHGRIDEGITKIKNGLSTGVKNTLKGINTALQNTNNMLSTIARNTIEVYNTTDQMWSRNASAYNGSGASGSWGEDDGNGGNGEDGNGGNGNGGGSRNRGSRNRGSRSRGSRSTTPKKASTSSRTTTPKETPEQKAAREAEEAFVKKMNTLNAEGEKFKMKALQERAKTEAKAIDELAEAQRQDIIKKYGTLEELQARLAKATTEEDKQLAQGAIDGYNALMADVEKQRSDAITKMVQDNAKAKADAEAKAAEDAKRLAQNLLAGTTEGTAEWLNYQLELIRMEKEAELALYGSTEEEKAAILAKYRKQEEDARMQNTQAIQQIEQTKYDAIGTMVGGLGEVVGAFGEQSKEAAVLQKTLALGEIMIAQAVAIANAVKAGSNAVTPWQLIAQIATSIVAVTTAMAQAFAALDSAKFATGGYIQGAGTSTSDSIPVRVSNGESIMNANTTAMFSGLLSSLNQLGGGVPIQAQQTASSVRGEDMLARAVARGVAMLPAPVVSVEDINRGQRQVEVMNERATL